MILSPGIYEIEKWAFRNSHLEQLYLYDDLEKISDYAFQDCDMLHTLHINAIELQPTVEIISIHSRINMIVC